MLSRSGGMQGSLNCCQLQIRQCTKKRLCHPTCDRFWQPFQLGCIRIADVVDEQIIAQSPHRVDVSFLSRCPNTPSACPRSDTRHRSAGERNFVLLSALGQYERPILQNET